MVHAAARHRPRREPAARTRRALVDGDDRAGAGELAGGGETREARTDHGDVDAVERRQIGIGHPQLLASHPRAPEPEGTRS